MTQPNPRLSSLFELEYPQSVGVYDSYVQAQAAVDFLADAKFAVQNIAIVGTDLKSVERVTGRRNWGTVLVRGLQSGLSTGLMVTFILWFLQPQANPFVLLPGALLIGILIGVAFSAIGYAASRGKRDFNSISQTVAARYEVLCEHKVAGQARELLATMPGARAAAFDPNRAPQQWQAGQYPGQSAAGYPAQGASPYPNQPVAQQYPGHPYPAQPTAQQFNQPGQVQPYAGQSYPQPPAPVGQPAQPPVSESAQTPEHGSAPRPYGEYGANEGIGRAPQSESSDASEQDGRTPRGDN